MCVAPLKRHCLEAANILAARAEDSLEPELVRSCSEAVRELAEHLDSCRRAVRIAKLFYREFCVSIKQTSDLEKAPNYILHDATFFLFESLIIVLREEALRNEAAKAKRPARAKAMRYFKQCGHWLPEDNTMVSDFFYRKLPSISSGLQTENSRGDVRSSLS